MLGISVDTPPSANAFAEKLGLDFPLLGDWPKYEVCRRYGTFDEERTRAARRTFVVDRDGIIRAIIDDPRDFARHAAESLATIRQLQG